MANTIKLSTYDVSSIKIGTNNVDAVYVGTEKVYPQTTNLGHMYTESTGSNSVSYTMRIGASVGTDKLSSVSYSTDSGATWVTTNNSASTVVIITTPSVSGKVYWKGQGVQISVGAATYAGINSATYLQGDGAFNVGGNAMSLLWGDDYASHSEFSTSATYELSSLFYYATTLISAENLILPAMTMHDNTYNDMFNHCSALTTSPLLPAQTLAASSYKRMFQYCSSLNNIRCLVVDTSATDCLKNWVQNVQTTSGSFYRNPNKSWARGNNGVPNNWTIYDYSS
jgi:hypothetical protein